MADLRTVLDREAERTSFSGVVRIDRGSTVEVLSAYGLADRAHGVRMTASHQLGTASVTKGFTAVAMLGLVAEGACTLTTTARSVLGADLPMIDDDVTVEQLLSHRSGIGDYLDESLMESSLDYVMPVPVHRLVNSDDYLPILDGRPMVSAPGSNFEYNNGAFVVLAIMAERIAATPFHELVAERVLTPAGMVATEFLRSDELPGTAAIGYLEADGLRTNVLHLPVRGSGDGGAYTTAADMTAFWRAVIDGRIVPEQWVAEMLVPRHEPTGESPGYGLGLWLHEGGALELHGYDAGVSFLSIHDPASDSTWTVASNTSSGSSPLERILRGDVRS